MKHILTVIILLIIIANVAHADNMYIRHGAHHFQSKGVDIFPLIWDIRAARMNLSSYCHYYGLSSKTGFDLLEEILTEAKAAGITAVCVRDEIRNIPLDLSYKKVINSSFALTAEVARQLDLDVFAGGFYTDPEVPAKNDHIVDFLQVYQSITEPHAPNYGRFLGVTAFDEPDAKWNEASPQHPWINMVETYRGQVNTALGLPFGSMLDRYDQLSIETFCPLLDYPVYDRYPYNCYEYNDYEISSTLNEFCATELYMDNSMSYQVYATQDEMIRVYPTSIHIYQFYNEHEVNGLQSTEIYSHPTPPGSESLCYSASDYRSMDVGNRQYQTMQSDINGAVVLWREGTNSNRVHYNHNGEITNASLPLPGTCNSIIACCVGETCYPLIYPTYEQREGLVGHGQLRILYCYDTNSDCHAVRVLSKDYTDDVGFVNVTNVGGTYDSLELPVGFEPMGIIWGAFWHRIHEQSDSQPIDPYSGFILYDEIGDYVVVYQIEDGDDEEWELSGLHHNLLPRESTIENERMFISRSDLGQYQFAAGRDYICYLPASSYSQLNWTYGDAHPQLGLPLSGLTRLSYDYSPGSIISVGADRAGRDGSSLADRLIVSASNGTFVGDARTPIGYSDDPIELEQTDANASDYMVSARIYDTRRPFRSALVRRTAQDIDDVCILDAQLAQDGQYDVYDTEMNAVWTYGVDGDPLKCFIPNIQAYGRHGQEYATYAPSLDQLRYMAVTAILNGARGLRFYALDLALATGNGVESQTFSFASPAELVNWGPSQDEDNANMITRVHTLASEISVFKALLMSGGSCALADDVVDHAYYDGGYLPDSEPDSDVNFLALESPTTGNICVLVTNNSAYAANINRVLWFMGRLADEWELTHVGGYQLHIAGRMDTSLREPESNAAMLTASTEPNQACIVGSRDEIPLMVSYEGMPPYSSSLCILQHRYDHDRHEGRADCIIDVCGTIGNQTLDIRINAGYRESTIDVYDITGRCIENLVVETSGNDYRYTISTGDMPYPNGQYYVVVDVDGEQRVQCMTVLQ